MKRNRKAAGISLVALVITIIVLIILTGAVIVTFMEGGIIDRAKESVFKNDMRTYQEILALKRAENQMEIALGEKEDVEINATTVEEIQEIIPEFKEEYEGLVVIKNGELSIGERVTGEELSSSEELYATWLSDLGIGLSRLPKNAIALVEGLEVGDYVVYAPDGNNVTSYELLGEDSGYCGEVQSVTYPVTEINQTITRQRINWRVLKNDGRQVTLISEEPIDSIGLCGTQGFLNGPEKLNEIYRNLYSGNKGTARNLNIEDVNEAMQVVVGDDVKPSYTITPDNIVYYDRKATFADAIEDYNWDTSKWTMPDENYREYELSYDYLGSTYKTRNEEAYKLIFKNAENNEYTSVYWLSSSCVQPIFSASWMDYHLYSVDNDKIIPYYIHYANDYSRSKAWSGRPIVILNSDVEVANPTAGGDTVATAWKLK